MAFGAYYGETAGFAHFGRELDVGSAACHVGGYCYDAAFSGVGHNVGLLLVELCVEHVVLDFAHIEHLAEHFGNLHARRAHQNGAAGVDHLLNLLDYGFVFFALRLVNAVVHVVADYRAVGGDFNNVELVDVPELSCFRACRTCHAGELVVHTEVVLERDGCESLGGGFNLHVFLCLYRLMESVAPAAAFHYAPSLLVNNLHLSVYDHIVVVAVEHCVSLEQLLERVYALALYGVVREKLVLLVELVLLAQVCLCLERGKLRGYVGQHEEVGIRNLLCKPFVALVGEVNAFLLFVNNKVERVGGFGHQLVVVLHIICLGLEHSRLDTCFGKVFYERLVLGEGFVGAEQLQEALCY